MSVPSAAMTAIDRTHQDFSLESLDDSALFERLVSRHKERLYRVAYRMTGNSEDAQDLLQDAVIEAYRAFKHFKRGSYFDKWLYRIMTRTFIDHKRSQKRAKFVSIDDHGNGIGDFDSAFDKEIADHDNNPATLLDRETLDHRLQSGIEKLSPDYRLVLIMADIEEFSYEEIAAFLDCPIGTVRSRLHRARAQIREYLTKAGFSHSYSG
jgi:RNA polymerase sigma-70 factor (ECF subfamily)